MSFKEQNTQSNNRNKIYLALIAFGITVAVIYTVLTMTSPTSNGVTITSIKNNATLTSNLMTGQNTTSRTVTMVYKDGCQYCESARKTIETELSKNNKQVVQFSQIDGTTPDGKALLKKFDAKGVPLVIVTNPSTNTSHAFNDSDEKGIKNLLNKYAFDTKD